MSHRPLSHSPDLARLMSEGYELEIRAAHLFVHHVPFLNAAGAVGYGTLVSTLALSGDMTVQPETHTIRFIGGIPHDANGQPQRQINEPGSVEVMSGVVADCGYSAKPVSGAYDDYHHKVTTYVGMISGPVAAIDPRATAQTHVVHVDAETDPIFRYGDSASARVGITAISERLRGQRVAIVGLGGSGSYILDFVAKTHVAEIHLFDGDTFDQHNAFRAPGAWTLDELRERPNKAENFREIYSRLRHGVVAHPHFITVDNADELAEMTFAFLSMDDGPSKQVAVEALERAKVPFIDVGMGVERYGDALGGIVRITTSTPERRSRKGMSFAPPEANAEYDSNIQIAELNALNATLAVIRWKKIYGIYSDQEYEHYSAYSLDGNHLLNEDVA